MNSPESQVQIIGLTDKPAKDGLPWPYPTEIEMLHYEAKYELGVAHSLVLVRDSLIEELRKRAHFDPLTGLANRFHLEHVYGRLQDSNAKSQAERRSEVTRDAVLMFMDLDNFKKVNDELGHQGGDNVLKAVSGITTANIRSNDLACRWGGDEIVLFLPRIPKERATLIAEAIRHGVESSGMLTISIGIGEADLNLPLEENVHRINQALHEAKKEGKNIVVWKHESED